MAAGGYRWWYVDALSDDGRHGLTLIAFVGSVFSPYYTRARNRLGAVVDPQDHCALNVALYGADGHRWAMTERGRGSVARSAEAFLIGPSRVSWEGDHLLLAIDERTTPWGRRLAGTVRVRPQALSAYTAALDPAGRHRWTPLAPCAEVALDLPSVGLRWRGRGYLDGNEGDEPIDRPFHLWDWSRMPLKDGSTAVMYDVRLKAPASERGAGIAAGSGERLIARRFYPDGREEDLEPPPRQPLARSAWGIARSTRSEGGFAARVHETLEDTPFYVRDVVRAQVAGEAGLAMHETLHLPRLVSCVVQCMLPFRMPRRP